MADELHLDVVDGYRDELPPLEMDGAEQEPEAQEEAPPVIVTEQQVAYFLKLAYEAHGKLWQCEEIWKQDEAWFQEVAAGITPDIQAMVNRWPALGHAIHTANAAGSWGRLCLDYGMRTWLSIQARRERKERMTEQEEGGVNDAAAADANGVFATNPA